MSQKPKEDAGKEKEKGKKGEDGKEDDKDGSHLDCCLTSATLNIGAGLLGGFLGSILVRKRWPIVVGLGFGTGQSIGICKEEFAGEKCEEKDEGGDGKDKKKDKKADDKKGGKTDPKEQKGGKTDPKTQKS